MALMAALGAGLHSCASELEGVEDVAAVTSDDITVAPFPGFNDPQTRSTDAGAGHDKTSWEKDDVIYIQLNGEGSWYTMTYDGSTWSLSDDFPGMTREDSYKAVYAPNYEPNSDGTDLKLKSDAQPATAEYLTCEGKKPINISFKRDYARIRLYTGGLTVSYKTLLDAAAGFKSDDDFNYMESSMSGYTYTFTPDEYDNAYLYGTWSAYGIYFTQFVPDFGNTYLYLGPKYPNGGYTVNTASSANKSYVVDLTYVTLDLDLATEAAVTVDDWSLVVNAGITKVKMAGEWNSSYKHSFNRSAVTSIDLSEVTGVNNNLPQAFCGSCSSLKEVKLPENVSYIPYGAFQNCYVLKEINIPSNVESIDTYGFMYCYGLESVELPKNLARIEFRGFCGCKSLSKVVCYATTQPTLGTSVFDSTPADKVLYVPDETAVKAYKASANWYAAFGDNIKPISEMPEDE
jgi:hypothetical protein